MTTETAKATPTAEEVAQLAADKLAADTAVKAAETAKAGGEEAAKKAADEAAAKKVADDVAAKKAADEAAAKAGELKLPDGSKLDAKRVETFKALAKEKGWSPEDAQARLQAESDAVTNYHAQQEAAYKAQAGAWVDSLKNDKEFGGDKFNENVELSKRVVAKFGDDELKNALDDTGLGNHPGLVKMLVKIGKSMAPDKLIMPGHQPAPGAQQSPADKLFGSPPKKE